MSAETLLGDPYSDDLTLSEFMQLGKQVPHERRPRTIDRRWRHLLFGRDWNVWRAQINVQSARQDSRD